MLRNVIVVRPSRECRFTGSLHHCLSAAVDSLTNPHSGKIEPIEKEKPGFNVTKFTFKSLSDCVTIDIMVSIDAVC